MLKAIQTSVSGLVASSTRLNVAASNIVNSRNISTPGADSGGFIPQQVVQTTTGFGGVQATAVPVSPASLTIFNPSSTLANEQGNVNIPNISLPLEFGELIRASQAYKANANVLKKLDETFNILLKI